MELQRKLLENSAYRIFTEKLLDYMMRRAGLQLPEGTVLGHCCLCDEYEWIRCIDSDKEPMAVTATLKRGRFNMGDILVNTKRLNDRNGFSFFSLSQHQLTLLSLNTIHELVHFWFDAHCDQFYGVMTKTGVIVDYDKPRNIEGYLMEQGIDEALMQNAAEFLVDTYNEIELSGMCRFMSLNNLLFRV
jgi:hypothetical protein